MAMAHRGACMFLVFEHPLLVACHSAMAQPLLRVALAAAALSPVGRHRKHRAVGVPVLLRTDALPQLCGSAADVWNQRALGSGCRRLVHVGLRIDRLPDPGPGDHDAIALAKPATSGNVYDVGCCRYLKKTLFLL